MEKIKIRPARREDFAFVRELMTAMLSPYYDGDHAAHAERLFETHLAGGRDKDGAFSLTQRLFVLTVDKEPAGLVHLVSKLQGTWKISPLIVSESARGKHGYGTRLLRFAERYASQRGAMQMYCTVAETNTSALRFFRRHGYVVAGRAREQYRVGVVEVALYKSFHQKKKRSAEKIHVVQFNFKFAVQVREIILRTLPTYFKGIGGSWVDRLFLDCKTRKQLASSTNQKLTYIAINNAGQVRGVAIVIGDGILVQIVPFSTETPTVFRTMLTKLSHRLRILGSKVILHCIPTVAEVEILQRLGWQIEAMLPGAYHPDHVTQQWSLMLDKEDEK